MARNIAVGIDLGSSTVKVVVAERGNSAPRILATGVAESKGLRHGYVVNSAEAARAVKMAKEMAEKQSGIRIESAIVSVGGVGLSGITSSGTATITRQDDEIHEGDIEEALRAAENAIPKSEIKNRRILYNIPTEYIIDKKPVFGKVLGMRGSELTVKALFITCLESHVKELVETLAEAGIETLDVCAAPIAASFVTLTKSQKIAGCILVNIGSETTSVAVFENNLPLSLEVFPMGSVDITHALALGLKISLEEAEMVKRGGITNDDYPRRKLDDIITSRMGDIFDLVEAHLKKTGRAGLLPAGVVVVGGGANFATIEDFARAALRLPSRIAHIELGHRDRTIRDSSWAVAYGLCYLGLESDDDFPLSLASLSGMLKKRGKLEAIAKNWFSKFIP